jgi:dTDP-4-dehydrorhamnose 3,5-epimerase
MTRSRGTLRGLHFQIAPYAEIKLVRCINGAIWDVIVDLRIGSKTFGKWFGKELSDVNRTMMYVPAGFAHGFVSLTDESELLYLVSEYYSPTHEKTLSWSDTCVAIDWPTPVSFVSEKDNSSYSLTELLPILSQRP